MPNLNSTTTDKAQLKTDKLTNTIVSDILKGNSKIIVISGGNYTDRTAFVRGIVDLIEQESRGQSSQPISVRNHSLMNSLISDLGLNLTGDLNLPVNKDGLFVLVCNNFMNDGSEFDEIDEIINKNYVVIINSSQVGVFDNQTRPSFLTLTEYAAKKSRLTIKKNSLL